MSSSPDLAAPLLQDAEQLYDLLQSHPRWSTGDREYLSSLVNYQRGIEQRLANATQDRYESPDLRAARVLLGEIRARIGAIQESLGA